MDLKLEPFITEKNLVFTVTSDGYKYLTWNLYKILQELKLPWKLCILCLDKESHEFLSRIAQIPSRQYYMSGEKIMHKDPTIFGTGPFKRMNRMKLKALEELSQRPELERLIYIDSDIAVFKDFIPYFTDMLQTEPLLFQCDERREDFRCSDPHHCTNPCTGVIGMLLNSETRPLFKKLFSIESETWKTAITDQDYVQNQLNHLQLSYCTLPRALFPNGNFLPNNKYKEKEPYLLHFNYIVGKHKKKIMNEKECWVLPEYV